MTLVKNIKNFLKNAEKPLVVILGPTASGKTALSLKLAKDLKGEIVSTDSRQIYKGMEISTDAIHPDHQEGVAHHLVSVTTPDQTITLAEYHELAVKHIKEIHKRKNIPILVGGTGLYISAITEGYEVPRIPPNEKLREKLRKEAAEKGPEYLHKKLAKLDPESAKKIHPNNVRYVIRALEINLAGKQNKEDKKKKKSPFDVFMLGLKWPREKLYQRINKRIDNQIKRGLIEEVKTLLSQFPDHLPAMSSLGVKEIVPHIKGEITLEESVEILKRNTRRYAKRQMTWFRRYDNVYWLNSEKLEEYLQEGMDFRKGKKVIKLKAPKVKVEKAVVEAKKPTKKVTSKPKKAAKKITKKVTKKPVKKIVRAKKKVVKAKKVKKKSKK